MELKVGLIGCGDIGRLRAAAVSRAGSLRLVAVNDLYEERAAAIAAKYGGIVDDDWRHLLGREEIDAVIISTPPSMHAEMCIEALKLSKHVLCEKPLARTPDECRRILHAAEKNSLFVGTGFNYRFYPSICKAREILKSGIIGELDHIRSYAGYSAADHSQPWIREVEVVGGGTLRDNGIHLIDLTRNFLGEVVEVKGFASNSVWGFNHCEDNGFALLRNQAGKIASLHASWTEWRGYRFLIEIYGTHGSIHASCFPMLTRLVWSKHPGSRTHRRINLFPSIHFMEHLRSYRWVVEQSLIQELRAFHRAIIGEKTELATGYDGMRAVEIAHAISGS